MDAKEQQQQLLQEAQSELARGLGRDLSLQQCKTGYIKLPVVPKKLHRGPKGGLFYVNQKGKQVYLNSPQKDRLALEKLPGVVEPPGGNPPPFVAGQVPDSVFERINREIRAAGGVI